LAATPGARAQTIDGAPSVALKNGETIEVGKVYWASHCKSLLKATPEVEILDGPDGVTAAIREEMVLPRRQRCGNKVAGGVLTFTAKGIEDQSYSNLTIRVTFKTRDGDRKFSNVYNISLFP
jgi:hypothetical protein